ncbi:MAG: hypothetical protein R2697_12810 [Ilumatobacteraceae bacterium]
MPSRRRRTCRDWSTPGNERRDVVECVTATCCYAAGDQFYRSDDGGVIWRLSESVAYLDRYDDDAIHCFDTDVCRYFGYWYYGRQSAGTSYMTLDGGLNWRRVGSLEWLAGLACPGPTPARGRFVLEPDHAEHHLSGARPSPTTVVGRGATSRCLRRRVPAV